MIGLAVQAIRLCLGVATLAMRLLSMLVMGANAALAARSTTPRAAAEPGRDGSHTTPLPSRRRAFTAPPRGARRQPAAKRGGRP